MSTIVDHTVLSSHHDSPRLLTAGRLMIIFIPKLAIRRERPAIIDFLRLGRVDETIIIRYRVSYVIILSFPHLPNLFDDLFSYFHVFIILSVDCRVL